MRYRENIPPEEVEDELRLYLVAETRQINRVLGQPEFDIIEFTVLDTTPDRPREGMVCYFATGAVSGGSAEGLWRYSTGGSWVNVG